MSEYYLVSFDSRHGNTDYKNDLVNYLKDNKFTCVGGYWGMPLYWIDIKSKIYRPGRPGVAYGKIIGRHPVTFKEFKRIYENEGRKI